MEKLDPRHHAQTLKKLLLEQIVQGRTPRGLALTCATGVVMGCMPFIGLTTLLLLLIGYMFKLNQPLLQAINYAMTPIHVLMLPIFFFAGHFLYDVPVPPIDSQIFWEELMLRPQVFLSRFGTSVALAMSVWLLLSPLLFFGIYLLTYRISLTFKKVS